MSLSPLLRRVGFDDVPGWDADDSRAAFTAYRRSAKKAATRTYRTGSLNISAAAFAPAHAAACAARQDDRRAARTFFETHFVAFHVVPNDRARGFVTGYYEPEVDAAPQASPVFKYPLLARPADLVAVDDSNRPPGLDPYFAFARQYPDGRIGEYFDRAAIESGALSGRGLEIAWLADPVDVFFVHVQGAARLRMPDGAVKRVTYAAKSGHRFTGPGGILAEIGELARENVTMQTIRAWFRDNSRRINEILWQNRSFIFFQEAPVDDPALGPVAAAKVPLTAGRSIAVDRLLHTFGTPIFVHAPDLATFGGAPFARLMIAQDTGSAITGSARGDLFAGSGAAAGDIAGVIRHEADFFVLVPRVLADGAGA